MDLRSHGIRAHSAYIDLRNLHRDEAVSDLRGVPIRRERNGRVYVYDHYRVGSRVVSRYLGEASAELDARLATSRTLRENGRARRASMATLMRVLRAEGLAGFDASTGSLLATLARIGVFRLGGTIVGTVAYRIYEGELGRRLGSGDLVQTGDVDVASFERLSLALADQVEPSIQATLSDLRMTPVPSLEPGRVWRWQDATRETLVEFLTPAFGQEGLRDLPALGVQAQGLHYLNFLLKEPIQAVALYRSGVLVQVPTPERYAIHKLIVADRRRDGADSLKALKDRAQAAALIQVLAEDRPDDLLEAYQDARSRGPRWRERLDRTLGRMPEAAARLVALG